MAENNATCSICDKGYHLCLSCKDSIKLSPWKLHCCSVQCYQTFQAVKGFSNGVYNKEEFKSKLKNIDLSNLENYREHIKVLIEDALKEENVVDVAQTMVATEENLVIKKPIMPRKRSYRAKTDLC